MFEVAAQSEIEKGNLSVIKMPDFLELREFNFVILKNSFFKDRYLKIYDLLKQIFNEIKQD